MTSRTNIATKRISYNKTSSLNKSSWKKYKPKPKDYDDRYIEAAKNNTALKKLGEAQDVADAVIFLSSNRAKYITGQTLYLDGGYRI